MTAMRAAGPLVGLERLDLADRHAGDPHVGLLRELGRLGERGLEAVALRLQRDRRRRRPATGTAAGRSTSARTRPSRRSGRSRGVDLTTGHLAPASELGQMPERFGPLSRSTSVPSCGLASATASRTRRRSGTRTRRGRGGSAPGVLGGEHRSAPGGWPRRPEQVALLGGARRVVGELVERVVEALEAFSRSGVAAARSRIAGRSSLTVGSAARENGRSSSRMIGVVSRRNGRTLRWVGPRPGRPGRSACSVGPSSSASACALPRLVFVTCQRGRQLAQRLAQRGVLAGEAANTALESDDELGDLVVLVAQLLGHQREVVDRAA